MKNQMCFVLSASTEFDPAIISGPFSEEESEERLKNAIIDRMEELNTEWPKEQARKIAKKLYKDAEENEDIAFDRYEDVGLDLNPGVAASIHLYDGYVEKISVCAYEDEEDPEKQTEMIMQLLSQNPIVKDMVYRKIWSEYVAEDVINHAAEVGLEISDGDAQVAADQYVNGAYDCNLSYWSNIENLIS